MTVTSFDINRLQTGDLLFCHEPRDYGGDSSTWSGWLAGGVMHMFSTAIQSATGSPFSHVAMVLRDPSFIRPPLTGLYVWESSVEEVKDPQDGKSGKVGVRMTPLKNFLQKFADDGNSVVLRRLVASDGIMSTAKLRAIHQTVYCKPYDLVMRDWIASLRPANQHIQATDRFWCSALVGYIYTKCGILAADTDWTTLSPADLAMSTQRLSYVCPEKACLDSSEVLLL